MKTAKLIILSAIIALTVYSCSSDREEDVQPAQKLELKKLNINQPETNRTESDTVIYSPSSIPMDGNTGPGTSTDPDDGSEIIPPGDVKPPKGK